MSANVGSPHDMSLMTQEKEDILEHVIILQSDNCNNVF